MASQLTDHQLGQLADRRKPYSSGHQTGSLMVGSTTAWVALVLGVRGRTIVRSVSAATSPGPNNRDRHEERRANNNPSGLIHVHFLSVASLRIEARAECSHPQNS